MNDAHFSSTHLFPTPSTTKLPHLRIFFNTPWDTSTLHGSISGAAWKASLMEQSRVCFAVFT